MAVIDRNDPGPGRVFFQFITIAVAISEKWPRSWSRDQTIAIVTNLFKPQETNLDPPESSESVLKLKLNPFRPLETRKSP